MGKELTKKIAAASAAGAALLIEMDKAQKTVKAAVPLSKAYQSSFGDYVKVRRVADEAERTRLKRIYHADAKKLVAAVEKAEDNKLEALGKKLDVECRSLKAHIKLRKEKNWWKTTKKHTTDAETFLKEYVSMSDKGVDLEIKIRALGKAADNAFENTQEFLG